MGDMHHWFCLLSVILILFRNVKCLLSDHGGGALWSATWQSSTGAFNLINICSRSWDKIHAQEFSLHTGPSQKSLYWGLYDIMASGREMSEFFACFIVDQVLIVFK